MNAVSEKPLAAGKSAVRSEVCLVTPQQASQWLELGEPSHRVNSRSVASYARDMSQGSWKVNGEPIIFSGDNKLLDGYARLHASIKSGKSFKTLVIHNVDYTGFETIDAVRKRTLGDILHIRKEPNGRQLAAALMIVWRHRQSDLYTQSRQATVAELLAILNDFPGIRDDSLRIAGHATPQLPLGLGTALHHLFARADRQKADEFFQEFVDGNKGSAAGLLKITLEGMAGRGGRRVQTMMIALSIKAWNAFLMGRSPSFLRYTPGREEEPQIVGLNDLEDDKKYFIDSRNNAEISTVEGSFTDLKVEHLRITPELAKQFLSHNSGNRIIADGVVAKYGRDMLSGEWKLNGQTIKIGQTGRLLDGQHRCSACVNTGRAFDAIVVWGVEDSSFDTFDLGGRRSFGDVLTQRGERGTVALAAALKWLWLYDQGRIFDRNTAPTNAELERTLNSHKRIRESVGLANKFRNVIAPGMGIALHYLFSLKDHRLADEFFERLCDGDRLTKEMPVYHLRERLIHDRHAKKVRVAEGERFVLAVKAWNAVRLGREMRTLAWRSKGPNQEAIPTID